MLIQIGGCKLLQQYEKANRIVLKLCNYEHTKTKCQTQCFMISENNTRQTLRFLNFNYFSTSSKFHVLISYFL